MAEESNDPPIIDNTTSPATYLYDRFAPEIAHALGAFLINWNGAEAALRQLVTHFLGEHTAPVVQQMTNQNRVALLKSCSAAAQLPQDTIGAIANFIEVLDVCLETRNIVCHGILFPAASGTLLAKRTGPKVAYYPIDADIISNYSDTSRELLHIGITILEHLRNSGETRIALPGKLPKPSKLRSQSQAA